MLSALTQEIIENDLAWRETELSLAKIQLHKSLGDTKHFRYAYRCFIAMTYAHFEGYIKNISAQVLDDIIHSGTIVSECNDNICNNYIAPSARRMISSLSNKDLIAKVFRANDPLSDIGYPSPEKIFEISNMDLPTFSKLVKSIGINDSVFEDYKSTIAKLTSSRHKCAHGEKLSFDSTQTDDDLAYSLFKIQGEAIKLMHHFAIEVIDHLYQRKYLLPTTKGIGGDGI